MTKTRRGEEDSSSLTLERVGDKVSPTHSGGSDYNPSDDEDRDGESEVDVTRGFGEEESI